MNLALGKKIRWIIVFSTIMFFGAAFYVESNAWARAGGGGSSGSRGSRSFSTPSSPSRSSPGLSTPGRSPITSNPTQSSGGFFGRSPFMQGLMGGLAGGMLGSLLFGGVGHAASGVGGGGGMGFMDFVLIGGILYLAYRFFKKRRAQSAGAGYYANEVPSDQYRSEYSNTTWTSGEAPAAFGELERGLDNIQRSDPGFNPEAFKETAQDIFFRIQAGWTNRSLDGIEGILTDEMSALFLAEFESMKQQGIVNHLENIAIRKVEYSEAWQETGKDFITVLFTANLLDYTVDATTRAVVKGDKMNPVKFQEFWTFTRDMGSSRWQLGAINQVNS